jgi:hypothetical protein
VHVFSTLFKFTSIPVSEYFHTFRIYLGYPQGIFLFYRGNMSDTNALSNKLLEIINQVQAGIVAKAPDAINLVLQEARIDAIGHFLGAAGCLLTLYVFWRIFCKVKNIKDEYGYIEVGAIVYMVISGAISVLLAGFVICVLFDIWNYVAIINPKLYLAHQLIENILN